MRVRDGRYLRRIAQSIKFVRTEKWLKQSEVAAELGLSTRHYQKIEAGEVDLAAGTGHAIAKTLEIEPCYVFRDAAKKSLEACGILFAVEILDLLPLGVQLHDIHGEI